MSHQSVGVIYPYPPVQQHMGAFSRSPQRPNNSPQRAVGGSPGLQRHQSQRAAHASPSPVRNQPNTRLELHNPSGNTIPAGQFALRPNHSRGYSMPQPQFTPSMSSPLRPRTDNTNVNGHASHNYQNYFQTNNNNNGGVAGYPSPQRADTYDVFTTKDDQSLLRPGTSNRRLRPSRSTEVLRKVQRPERDQNQKYHVLSDEDDDDERLRLPPDSARTRGPRLSAGAPTTLSSSVTTVEMMHADFPRPPSSDPTMSQDSFFTAQQTRSSGESNRTYTDSSRSMLQTPEHSSSHSHSHSHSHSQPPVRLPPYPAQASPSKVDRPLSDPILHAQDPVLIAAETGGMVGHQDGTYVKGRGPGEQYGSPAPAPRGPRGPQPMPVPTPTLRSAPRSAVEAPNNYPPIPVVPQRKERNHKRSHSDGEALAALARQGTLFHPASSQERAAKELDVMLGKPRSRRLSANRLLPAPETPLKPKDQVRLEAAKKGRARVELDVVIERECVVEGGDIRGRLEVVVRGGKRGKGLRVGGGKLRVLGFEETENGQVRHIFYQHQYPLREFVDGASAARCSLFEDTQDEEGFRAAKEGTHDLPFSMPLPVDGGAKGSYTAPGGKGPNIRYVVVGSIKLHIPSTGKRAIAHFYRPIVVLPYLNPATALAPTRQPIVAHTTSGLGWRLGGEKGKVEVQVALGRRNWVAGQRVWCEVAVRNQSHKKINRCALAVLQTVSTFGVPKANQKNPPAEVTRTKVSEEAVEADFMEVGSGHVTSKSWWTGLEPGESNRWDMSVSLPTGMISITRSRYVEVSYTLRVTLNNTIYVDVPLRLINFLSIDPPPMPSDRRYRMPIQTKVPVHAMPEPEPVAPVPSPDAQVSAPVSIQPSPVTTEELADDSKRLARSSGTTFDIDQLAAQGHVRAEGFEPSRPMSPTSAYSTMHSTQSTIKGKVMSESGHSIDEEERNYQYAEAARRDGREQSLRVINADTETLLTNSDSEDERLSPEDKGTYRPAETPAETGYTIGDDADISSSEFTDDDRTPMGSPRLEPDFGPDPIIPLFDIPDFTKHPRDEFLAHISEEEEPIDDDMLTEIVSLSGDQGGHLHYDGGNDDDDDMMDDEDEAHTPKIEPRRSLEDRLQGLVKPLPEPEVAVVEVPKGPPAVYAVLPRKEPVKPPTTVDYAEPLEIDNFSLRNISSSYSESYDGHSDSNSTFGVPGSPYQRPQTVMSYSTSSWSTVNDTERSSVPPPSLPSLASAREIRWGGTLTGRTVSGRSAMLQFSDDDTYRALSHASSMSTLRDNGQQEDNQQHESDQDDLETLHDLQPPNLSNLHATPNSPHGSYTTSASEEVPPLATPENSDSDSAETPESPTPRKPLYTMPLPKSPDPKRSSLVVPERFKPRVVSDAESHDSFISSTSTNFTTTTTDSVLPAVKARVAQIETRNEALRKFSVASSAGLLASPNSLRAPLSPATTSSGRISPNGRRSYTSALGGPRSRSPASIHSNTVSERSSILSSPMSNAFSFDGHSPMAGTRSLGASPVRPPRSLERSPVRGSASLDGHGEGPHHEKPHRGLDAAALGGTAFARGVMSPTSSLGHSRWEGDSELSHGAQHLLSRALSTCSNSTTATDVERALSPGGGRIGPRGPRARQPAAVSPTVSTVREHKALPFPPTMTAASTATPLPPLFISVKSESASLDGYSSDTYSDSQGHTLVPNDDTLKKTISHTSEGQFSDASSGKKSVESVRSDWSGGTTGLGWRGALRLPQLNK